MLEEWLHQLENVVEKLNENFSSFFENMGCCGEIHFKKPDNRVNELRFLSITEFSKYFFQLLRDFLFQILKEKTHYLL